MTLLSVYTATSRHARADDGFAGRNDKTGIDKSALRKLEDELAQCRTIESTTRRRRALRNLVRDAQTLVQRHADAPNRFAGLGLIFQAQRDLLVLRNDQRTRDELLTTCRALTAAPDEYARARLQAEFLLLQIDFDADGATEHQRAVAIAELADRYRDTAAEVQSLMLASEVAFNLGESDLVDAFRYTLASKFKDNLQAIAFLQDRFAFRSGSIKFRGRFERADGQTMVFPIDRMGHVYLSCFWSTKTARLKERLLEIKALRDQFPGRFEVFSFNLDELPDAGESALRNMNLDWTAMRLPGGADNPRFRAYGANDEFLIRITNLNGYATLTPIGVITRGGGRIQDLTDYVNINLEHPRYLSMFQSLRTGEFLILDPTNDFDPKAPPELAGMKNDSAAPTSGAVSDQALRAIQDCFTAPPMRYRLTAGRAVAQYEKCLKLCRQAIDQHPDADNLWIVRNRKIIAQLGLWNLKAEPRFIEGAAEDAAAVIKRSLPNPAYLPARFCMALQAIRREPDKAKPIITDFVAAATAAGGEPGALTIAAATVLTLNASEPELFSGFRDRLFEKHMDEPRVWSLVSCIHDKGTFLRLFRANNWGAEVMKRHGMLRWLHETETASRQFDMRLQTLDGKPMTFPHADRDKLNVAVFMEPPADAQAAAAQRDLIACFDEHTGRHLRGGVHLVIAFVRGERDQIRKIVADAKWQYPVAMVPGGLNNPGVLRLGIFAADHRPNTFVVQPDGTIRWSMTGMNHQATSINAVASWSKSLSREHDLAVANRALDQKDFKKALRFFAGSYPDDARKPADIAHAQSIGRAKAYLGLGQHETARAEFDRLIGTHEQTSARRFCGCKGLAELLQVRARLHRELDNDQQADADLSRAASLQCPPGGKDHAPGLHRFSREIHQRLETLRGREDWAGAIAYLDDIIARGGDGRQPERDQLAGWLTQRAQTLAALGEIENAHHDRRRASGLTADISFDRTDDHDESRDARNPRRYVDIVTKTNG